MNRYICIHGHFYQPPRENPWLEEIEIEDSAYPFHDWNERITSECYAPNASSRILGPDREIREIINNYSHISFNFGPTLLSWMQDHDPDLYSQILLADHISQKRFSGHGSAIAQIYNHIIMPLASSRDKETEVIWGIKDFISRFKRRPEGMWLAETAADKETLEILAKNGILFTILSPAQALRARDSSTSEWTPVTQATLDCGTPYLYKLEGGRSIAIFFYDATIANEIAFGKLLKNGENFARTMISSFPPKTESPRLLSVATDGETYGHHHTFGDMALAYALSTIESGNEAKITIFGEYLEKFPPSKEVEIRENTSWSCSHGVERWRDDCGCKTYHACLISDPNHCISLDNDHYPGNSIQNWNQKWRKELRSAMDWLNGELALMYDQYARHLFADPWQARNEYIDLILDRSDESVRLFFSKHAIRELSTEETVTGLTLLGVQRNVLLMNTSCGWFFDELSGIETIQVMKYACRAMQLAKGVSGTDLEPEYIRLLSEAKSNVPEVGTGADLYKRYVQSAVVDISRVAFHYAITSLIDPYPDETIISTYTVRSINHKQDETGILKLVTGHALFRSELTKESSDLTYAAIHISDHNFMGGVGTFTSIEAFTKMERDLWDAFSRSDVPGMILSLNSHFESHSYSLWHLFRDGMRKVLYSILNTTLADIESDYRKIHRHYFPLMKAMKEMHIRPPEALEYPILYILNHDIRQNLESGNPDLEELDRAVRELVYGQYKPDRVTLQHIAGRSIVRYLEWIIFNPDEIEVLIRLNRFFAIMKPLQLSLDLRESQNMYCRISSDLLESRSAKAETGDEEATQWFQEFILLGMNLEVIRKPSRIEVPKCGV